MNELTAKNHSEHEERTKLNEAREYKIIKANELIQKSRFQLTLQEQKLVLFLISRIIPEDKELHEYTFSISAFCDVCGIDSASGGNYHNIKKTIKALADKSIWIQQDDGKESIFRWIADAIMQRQSGQITVILHEKLKPYLLQIRDKFTQYALLYILAMKGKYSVRMYELLKSYEYLHIKVFDIDELRKLLMAEKYTRYADFKRNVLDISMREINDFSDMNVNYDVLQNGRKYAKLKFHIKTKKEIDDRIKTWSNIDAVLNTPRQMTLTSIFDVPQENEVPNSDVHQRSITTAR